MFSAPVWHVAHQIPKGNKFFLVPIASVCCVCVCFFFFGNGLYCSPKYSVTNLTQFEPLIIWPNRKFQRSLSLRVKTLLITSNTFWFNLTKQIKSTFCFCLILRYKAFLTVLVNISYFFGHGDLQCAHSPGHSFCPFYPRKELSYISLIGVALK